MGLRAERHARAEQKIQNLKEELLKVFTDSLNKNYSYESTMRYMDMAFRLAIKRNPQEAHLVRSAYTRLTLDVEKGIEEYKKIKKDKEEQNVVA